MEGVNTKRQSGSMKQSGGVTHKATNYKPRKTISFRLGELFAGPGGLALGAIDARIRRQGRTYKIIHEWASDYDKDSCDTFRHNIVKNQHSDSVICKDVRDLAIDSLSPIDGFAYGFPCNDFSVVGEHKGINGMYGGLYTYGIKVLNKFTPKFFVAENVGGMTSANSGKAFDQIVSSLAGAGNSYDLTVHSYNAADYGVPQKRLRIIIVGIDKTLNLRFRVPAPLTQEKPLTAREALELPPIPSWCTNQERTKQSKIVVDRLNHIKPGQNAWNADLPESLKLGVRGAKLSHIYKRLHPDKPSYTVTGSGGGGTHVYHYKEPRALTNRERARLQSFPDRYQFLGSKESVRKQIGMAVPPKLSQVIFTAVLKTFANVEYDYVESNYIHKGGLL